MFKITKQLTKNDHKSLNHIQIHNLGHFLGKNIPWLNLVLVLLLKWSIVLGSLITRHILLESKYNTFFICIFWYQKIYIFTLISITIETIRSFLLEIILILSVEQFLKHYATLLSLWVVMGTNSWMFLVSNAQNKQFIHSFILYKYKLISFINILRKCLEIFWHLLCSIIWNSMAAKRR